MSTRSVIARTQGDGWSGCYVHSDGYPTWQGHQLWQLTQDFQRDLRALMAFLLDGVHRSGWSWLPATRAEHDVGSPEGYRDPFPTGCYYHSRGDTEPKTQDSTDGAETWCEWAYAVNERTGKLFVFRQANGAWHLVPCGGSQLGNDHPVALKLLAEAEPDWQMVQARGGAVWNQ